jgi:hypothetical protein
MSDEILQNIRTVASKKILYLPHAIRQMSRPDRMITTEEIRRILQDGKVIENYPDDPRGHICLLLGFVEESRPIHVVCSPKQEFLAIITAYLPDENEWTDNFSKRKRQ